MCETTSFILIILLAGDVAEMLPDCPRNNWKQKNEDINSARKPLLDDHTETEMCNVSASHPAAHLLKAFFQRLLQASL